jgi:hypothetical protein
MSLVLVISESGEGFGSLLSRELLCLLRCRKPRLLTRTVRCARRHCELRGFVQRKCEEGSGEQVRKRIEMH